MRMGKLGDTFRIIWESCRAVFAPAPEERRATVIFAREPDGTWRICYDNCGLNAIARPAVEPLLHIDALS